jgi:uracil-DNA glycosylase family 4
MDSLVRLAVEVGDCRQCPRLVEWRELMADEKRASYRDQTYWGRGVPGFGDPAARVLVLGLAPAAHGANRTGRVFTGDRSGDWLFRSMHTTGFANQPGSTSVDDGLTLRGAWVTAAVKCAPPDNSPMPDERDTCRPFLQRELALLPQVSVIVCLGGFAYQAACQEFGVRPRPRFGHLVEAATPDGRTLLCSFHPSQQNTFTKRLTEPMLDAVFVRAAELAGLSGLSDGSVRAPGRRAARAPGAPRTR